MNMMTASNQKFKKILVRIRANEFGNRFKVSISIPVKFDIEDNSSTQSYYTAWTNSRNLPEDHPLHNCIKGIKEVVRFHEMQLVSRSGDTYVSYIGETCSKIQLFKSQLIEIFGLLSDSISFDV